MLWTGTGISQPKTLMHLDLIINNKRLMNRVSQKTCFDSDRADVQLIIALI